MSSARNDDFVQRSETIYTYTYNMHVYRSAVAVRAFVPNKRTRGT